MNATATITPEQQQDLMVKLDALHDAVEAAQATFERQMGQRFDLLGTPCSPACDDVTIGATIALTGECANFTYAVVCNDLTAAQLARWMFQIPEDEDPNLADTADALNEIPNVAAGMWKALRDVKGERYQLGLPLFLRGSTWLRFFSKGVNAMSQHLAGPDDTVLQVVLIWQSGVKPGGIVSMSTQTTQAADATAHLPVNVLQEATAAVVNTCEVQMGVKLEIETNPSDPREAAVDYGSNIALTTAEGGGWNLAVMGDRESCQKLTRILFAMEDSETPEMEDLADGIGEIANVAAGVFKASRLAAGQAVQIGLPLFMEGRGCIDFFASGLHGLSQSLNGPNGIVVHVIIIWQEG
ncbi:MAG: chemotaxis protein CheX [Candidatus Krumholzibacteriia bacterium]